MMLLVDKQRHILIKMAFYVHHRLVLTAVRNWDCIQAAQDWCNMFSLTRVGHQPSGRTLICADVSSVYLEDHRRQLYRGATRTCVCDLQAFTAMHCFI